MVRVKVSLQRQWYYSMKNKLFQTTDEMKVIRDPIHGYIHIEHQIIFDLITTPTFQRLKRIKQLGATSIVYPTAEHTRFSHSLGVYEITRRMVNENTSIANALTEEEKLFVMIAALCHDIGHGCFSHVFERITSINHEQVTQMILTHNNDIHNVLENYQKGLGAIIASIINHKYPKKCCWQLISSQLDADRMDYLLRDAYFTGTKYGEFDLERILRTLRIVNNELVVKQSGIYAVEDYLMARFHMFWQVYYHVNVRIYEQILIALSNRIELLAKNSTNQFHQLDKLIHAKNINLNLYLAFDDATMSELYKSLSLHEDPIIADLSSRLLNRNLFKEYPYSESMKQELIHQCNAHHLDPTYYVLEDNETFNATQPYHSTGKQKINILMRDQSILEFTQASAIMKSLSQAHEQGVSYLFAPRFK